MKKEVKDFLEGKPSLQGQKIWDGWFRAPRMTDYENEIVTPLFKLQKEIDGIKKKSYKRLGLNFNQFRIAASVAVFIGVGSWLYSINAVEKIKCHFLYNQSVTKNGECRIVNLSDGTQIYLNTGSVLKYPKTFEGHYREVYLEGEAFFDVAKDKNHPFIIHTPKMNTQVIGTSFNIQAYDNQKNEEVAVVTGKVAVKSLETNQKVFITPGQKISLEKDKNIMQQHKIDIAKISTWRNNSFYFDNMVLSEVIATLSRNYNIKIELKNNALQNLKINAGFEKLTSEEVITLLCNIIDATYSKENSTYIINSK